MAGQIRAYAQQVTSVLPADAATAELLAAGDALDTALGNGVDLDQALQRWTTATSALGSRLADYLLAQVPIKDLPVPDDDWQAPNGITLDAALGPLEVHVDCDMLRVPDPRPGKPGIVVGPLPPNAVGAHLAAGPVVGDGMFKILPDGVSGMLAAHLGVVDVGALASLRKVGGEPSFAAVFSAGFTPGIQFGFGFQLNRLGGVVGINRRVDDHALAAHLRDGSATEVLFPLDLGSGAAQALANLEQLLPPSLGSSVVGPTLRLAWLEVAGVGFFSLDLGILIELPGPQRIVLVGVAKAGIAPVVQLRIDVLGILDFAKQTLSIDASLVDSGLLGIFVITGDVAFRQCWGPQAYTVFSAGGFYPGFRPEPADIPPMRRLGFHLDVPVPGIDLRSEGYFAVTSNSLQMGGHFEAGIDCAGCGAHGFLSVDAIVQFSPFHIHAEVSAGFEVEVFGLTFCGVRLDGSLDAPGPVTIHGRMTIETFLHDFDFDETFTFGSPAAQTPIPTRRAAEIIANDEIKPSALRAVGGADDTIVASRLAVPPGLALVWPLGGVAWSQKRLPLTIPVDRLDGAPLGSTQTVTASVGAEAVTTTQEEFAPGSFITLTNAEAMNRPAYEVLTSGLVSAGGSDLVGATQPQPEKRDIFRKVRGELDLTVFQLGFLGGLAFPSVLLDMLHRRDGDPAVHTQSPIVTAGADTFVTSTGPGAETSATAAHQAVRVSADTSAFAVSVHDMAVPVVLAGL